MRSFLRLFTFNIRVFVSTGYWLYVLPVAACSLLTFWYMALKSLFTASTAAQTPELIAPILAAFLCAHVLAPEYRYQVDDLMLVRPLSFVKVVLLRLIVIYAGVAILTGGMLVCYRYWMNVEFDLWAAVAAGFPSILFLSLLAVAVADYWHNPMLGLVAAGAYWLVDVARGPQINPIATLHSYSAHLVAPDAPGDWRLSKLVLVALALVCVWFIRQAQRRAVARVRLRGIVRTGSLVMLAVIVLVAGGAWLKAWRGLQVERSNPARASFWYFEQFRVYGRVPVAYLLGAPFAKYVGFGVARPAANEGKLAEWIHGLDRRIALWREIAARYPHSHWADNAMAALIVEAQVNEQAVPTPAVADSSETPPATSVHRPDFREAKQYFETMLQTHPDSPFLPLAAARIARMAAIAGDVRFAEQTRMLILKRWPTAPEAIDAAAGLARRYLEVGQKEQAVEVIQLGVQAAAHNRSPAQLIELGDVLVACGDVRSARKVYQQAMDVANELSRKVTATTTYHGNVAARHQEISKLKKQIRERFQRLDSSPRAGG